MLGKAEWFEIRKWGGWGIQPKTKEGYIYLAIFVLPFIIFQSLANWDNQTRMVVTGVWLTLLSLDVLDIMARLKKDERELINEAIAERNAGWFMVAGIFLYMSYQSAVSLLNGKPEIDPVLLLLLLGGAAVKTISYWKMEK